MYYSIRFNIGGKEVDTFEDWRIVPASRPVVNPPVPKLFQVDVPGRNGLLDLTDTLFGKTLFSNRTGDWEFIVLNPFFDPTLTYDSWDVLYNKIILYLNGKRGSCMLESEPGRVYEGRFSVVKWSTEDTYSRITIHYDLLPFSAVPESLRIVTPPRKLDYKVDEAFDRTGMVVTAVYEDGNEKNVTEYSVDPEYMSMSTSKVNIVYRHAFASLIAEQPVRVHYISRLRVASAKKQIYYKGDLVNPDDYTLETVDNFGIVSPASINDYEPRTITCDVINSGVNKITFTHVNGKNSYTTFYDIVIRVLVSINVVKSPNKTTYYETESHDPSGCEIEKLYNDGFTQICSVIGISTSCRFIDGAYKMRFATSQESCGGTIVTFIPINVIKAVKIEVYQMPNKTKYSVGEIFSEDGMVINIVFEDGHIAPIDYTVPKDSLKLEDTYVIATAQFYNIAHELRTFDVKVPITVRQTTGIRIAKHPNKTTYVSGETFDSTGMIVEVQYSDGTYAATTDYTVEPTVVEFGTTIVVVHYLVYQANVPVKAIEDMGLVISKNPDKTTYIPNEYFDPTGMVVEMKYSDGSFAEVKDYTVEPEIISASTTEVSVKYHNYTAKVKITVITVTLSRIEITKAPSKLFYQPNEIISMNGMVVTAHYSDGTSRTVSGYEWSPKSLAKSGNITISYTENGYTAQATQYIFVRKTQ